MTTLLDRFEAVATERADAESSVESEFIREQFKLVKKLRGPALHKGIEAAIKLYIGLAVFNGEEPEATLDRCCEAVQVAAVFKILLHAQK